MSNNSSSSDGVGFVGLLTIAFIILKLCGVINWSWWWVLSPTLISAGLAMIALAVLLILKLLQKRDEKKLLELIQREKLHLK